MSNTTSATARKSTKAQLRDAVDSVLYRYDSLTGGTSEEVRRQAPRGIVGLQELVDRVTMLAQNPNKAAAADAHLMEYALRVCPDKLAFYRRYVDGTPEFEAAEAARAQVIAEREAASEREERALEAFMNLANSFAAAAPSNIIHHNFRAA